MEFYDYHFPGLEFESWSWKVMEMTKMIVPRTTKQEIPQTNDCFHIILETTS